MTIKEEYEVLKKKVEAECYPLERRLRELQHLLKTEENAKVVGSYFKVVNSGGSGRQWFLYAQATGLNDYGSIVLEEYQITPVGAEIKQLSYEDMNWLMNFQKITRKEFEKGRMEVLKALKLR